MKEISAWEKVKLARLPERPKALDYINEIFDDFIELHGDRLFGDDKSIVGGIATIKIDNKDVAVTVIGEQKGKRKYGKKFWYAKSRRIQKIYKAYETSRKV